MDNSRPSPAEAITKFLLHFEIAAGRAKMVVAEHKLCHVCASRGSEHSFMLSFSSGLRNYCVLLKGVIEYVHSKVKEKLQVWCPVCGCFKGTLLPLLGGLVSEGGRVSCPGVETF